MKMLFIEYPKCTTCIKAKNWLINNKVDFVDRDIKNNNPTKEELKEFIKKSNLEIKSFFNTSGLLYKELNLKEKLPLLSDEEKIELLATNGMLVKRPLIVSDDFVLVGFREEKWKEKLSK